jgi:hypothetical protein
MISQYCGSIFADFIEAMKEKSRPYWHTIQFIFLQHVYHDGIIDRNIYETVTAKIYSNESQIEDSLRSLVKQTSTSCEDIRILNVQYII